MKKFLALMALILCFTVLFVACDNNDDPTPTEPPTEAPTHAPAGCEHEYDNACDADCNLCGEQREPAAHVEEIIAAVAPTCTKAGLTEGKVCTVCGVVTVAQDVAPATGHTEVALAGVAATCTEAGLTEGKVCTVCGVVTVEQEVIFATGHDVEVVEGVAATCTEDGLTSGKKCSVCNVWVQEQTVIPATGHAEKTEPSIDPTCTEPGYKGATVCTVCGEVLSADREIPALGHTEVDIPEVAATCTKAGSKDGKMCITCGEVLDEPKPTKLAKHSAQKVSGYEPTCTTAGLSDGTVCKVCGEVIKAQTVIPATHGELVAIPEVLPTCTTLGYTGGSKCSVCDAVIEAQTVVPYAHTYAYTCSEVCELCGYVRSTEPMHVWGTANNGELSCVYGCGTAYLDPTIVPSTYTSGEALYNRVLRAGELSSAYVKGFLSYNEEGYITISGADTNGDPGMDHVIAVPFGPTWDGEGQVVTQQYLVMRYRTDTACAEMRFVTWNVPIMICKNLGTAGEWETVIIDLTDVGQNGERIDIRCNIGANTTDISHLASFSSAEEAAVYATNLSYIVDNKCPHLEYTLNWNNDVVCTNCYEALVPTTSHVGSEIYDAVDPESVDYALVTDNGRQGVTVTGVGQSLGGESANLNIVNDTNFGGYMVVVYKMDVEAAYFGVGANGGIASYIEASQVPGKWTVGAYGITRAEGNVLELICNYAGASNTVGVYAVYTFDSEAAAAAYVAKLATVCFHDETTVEAGRVTCTACGAVQGATAEWPLELNAGWVTTPEFVAGTSLENPGVQQYYYVYEVEADARLIIEAGENVSVIVNGSYVESTVDVVAGDFVEVIVYANWDEEWNLITDSVGFPVEIALPGSANNPFELVLGEATTPEFVAGTSLENPGVQEYHYQWVADGNGKFDVSEAENISWSVNGVWVDGYTAELVKGDVVEITVYALRDENNAVITAPATFSAEFDVKHEMIITEDGAITCNKGCHEAMTPATYAAGKTLDDKKIDTHYKNEAVYNEEGYITLSGASTAGDPGTDKVYTISDTVAQRFVVMRYRTTDAAVTFRFVTYGAPAEVWHNLGTAGEWQTVVVDIGCPSGGNLEIRGNIGASADGKTDISHLASFNTVGAASAYANQLSLLIDGTCPHNGYTTTVTRPATCVDEGEQILHCDACDLTLTLPIGIGAHASFKSDEAGTVVCEACGAKSTPRTFQAYGDLFDAVVAGDAVDAGDEGITITGVGTGNVFGPNDTTRVQIKSSTGYGHYLVVVYKSNYTDAGGASYLAIGNNDNSGSTNYAGGIVPSEGYRAYLFPNTTGVTGIGEQELNLLFHFGGNANSVTNILGVITFNTLADAEVYTEYLNAAFGVA